jgi:hypothetical protein
MSQPVSRPSLTSSNGWHMVSVPAFGGFCRHTWFWARSSTYSCTAVAAGCVTLNVELV